MVSIASQAGHTALAMNCFLVAGCSVVMGFVPGLRVLKAVSNLVTVTAEAALTGKQPVRYRAAGRQLVARGHGTRQTVVAARRHRLWPGSCHGRRCRLAGFARTHPQSGR